MENRILPQDQTAWSVPPVRQTGPATRDRSEQLRADIAALVLAGQKALDAIADRRRLER